MRRIYVPQLEILEDRSLPSADFKILTLTNNDGSFIAHESVTGNERSGLAVSSSLLFYTGDDHSGHFPLDLISETGTSFDARYDGLVSNLRTETVYALGTDATTPIDATVIPDGGFVVTHLLEINGSTGALTGSAIALVDGPITLDPLGETGVFSGYDRIIIHPRNGSVFSIELPSGVVTNLGTRDTPQPPMRCHKIGYWGVAERFGDTDYLAYIQDNQSIVRQAVSGGDPELVAQFSDLGNACAFTVSLATSRWYFHHSDIAQSDFGGTVDGVGILVYAKATFQIPNSPPVINLTGSSGNQTDAQNQQFTWAVTDVDDNLQSVSVTITKDGNTIHTSSLADGSFDFNSEGPGDFEITVSATDIDLAIDVETLNIAVADDDAAPPLIQFANAVQQTDEGNNSVGWTIIDAVSGVSSRTVNLYAVGNATPLFTNSSDDTGAFDLNGLAPGQYRIEAIAADGDFDDLREADRSIAALTSAEFTLGDDDTEAPTIQLTNAADQFDTADSFVGWTISDVSGIGSLLVRLFAAGNVAPLFTETTDADGTFDLDGLTAGAYRIEVTATDADADRTDDSMTATVSQIFSIIHVPMPGAVQFTTGAYLSEERVGEAIAILERVGGDGGPFTVRVTSTDQNATAGTDYSSLDQIINFGFGENQKMISIQIRDEHRVCEPSETFRLTISEPTDAAVLGANWQTTIVILESQSFDTLNRCWVGQVYEDLLFRPVEQAGLDYWTQRLIVAERDQVVLEIQNSPEYHELVVRQLGDRYFNREFDNSELPTYVSILANGGGIKDVAQSMAGSDEYFNNVGDGTSDGFLRVLYVDVFGQTIPDDQAAQLAAQLPEPSDPPSRELLANGLFESPEFLTGLVQDFYFDYLHRNGEPDGVAYYLNRLNSGERYEQIIASFLGSREYYFNLRA